MLGEIRRTGKNGATLAWNLAHSGSKEFVDHPLAPDASAEIQGEWVTVAAGDTMDFVLRAPDGDASGSVGWTLRVVGRESPTARVAEIGTLRDQFPTSDSPAPAPIAGDPWADLIQMLWASNEFNFID
jgi:endonuclease YncB( thermonuclease family)